MGAGQAESPAEPDAEPHESRQCRKNTALPPHKGPTEPRKSREVAAPPSASPCRRSFATNAMGAQIHTTFVPVRLAFTWLGVRETLAPEQRTTAARAFHADRELRSASKLILDLKHPSYRAVATVRSEASGYWRTVTLPFPEAGIRLLPQNSLGLFATTMQTYRERLQEAARELAAQYNTMKSEARAQTRHALQCQRLPHHTRRPL